MALSGQQDILANRTFVWQSSFDSRLPAWWRAGSVTSSCSGSHCSPHRRLRYEIAYSRVSPFPIGLNNSQWSRLVSSSPGYRRRASAHLPAAHGSKADWRIWRGVASGRAARWSARGWDRDGGVCRCCEDSVLRRTVSSPLPRTTFGVTRRCESSKIIQIRRIYYMSRRR